MKHVTCKIIIASTFVITIIVIGTVRTLHYPTHTSTPFQKKVKSTFQHTHYTPKPNHEKVTKTSIKFDDIDKWVHYGQKNKKHKKRLALIKDDNGNAKAFFLPCCSIPTHTHKQT